MKVGFALLIVLNLVTILVIARDEFADAKSDETAPQPEARPWVAASPSRATGAGPINVQRQRSGRGYQGIPTFFKLPVAMTPADLEAGCVDVAIMGAYIDMGYGSRGAAHGPNALRVSDGDYLSWTNPNADGRPTPDSPHLAVMVDPFVVLDVVDYGDAPNNPFEIKGPLEVVAKMVAEIASVSSPCDNGRRVIPFIVGGDHSLMYGDVKGLTKVYGRQTFGVLHFDAHYDASNDPSHSHTHGSPVRNLFEEKLVRGRDFIQIGLRGYSPSNEDLDWMIKHEFNFHTMAEADRDGWDTVMDRVIEEAQGKPQFVSFDIDVIDPAYAPGTGTPEPGGLTTREALPLVRRICAEVDVIGFELVELLPYRDPGYITVLNANRVVRECLTGIAMRRLGGEYREPYYRSPRSVPRRD